MGFEQVLNNLTLKRLTALMKKTQSVVDYSLNDTFWLQAVLSTF